MLPVFLTKQRLKSKQPGEAGTHLCKDAPSRPSYERCRRARAVVKYHPQLEPAPKRNLPPPGSLLTARNDPDDL